MKGLSGQLSWVNAAKAAEWTMLVNEDLMLQKELGGHCSLFVSCSMLMKGISCACGFNIDKRKPCAMMMKALCDERS